MKIEAPAFVVKGKLRLSNEPEFKSAISALKDCEGVVVFDTDTKRKTKRQRGYYWSTIVPHTLIIMRDECGYSEWRNKTNNDAHEMLKYLFNPKEITLPSGKKQTVPGSTKGMKKEQAKNFIDSIILWGWDYFSYAFPPPRKGQDKYFVED